MIVSNDAGPGTNLFFCWLPAIAAGIIVYGLIAVMGPGPWTNAAFFGGGAFAVVVGVLLTVLFIDDVEPPASAQVAAKPVPVQVKVAAAPAPAAAAAAPAATAAAGSEESKPTMLAAPRAEGADDLKKISGVGPKLEEELNAAGVYHFDQIASWTDAQVAWADENLIKFKGRISRDDWVGKAKTLMKG